DAAVEQPAMKQHDEADEAGRAAQATNDDRHHLLEAVADSKEFEDRDRSQQADAMPEQYSKDSDVEQNRAPDQLPATKQLARLRPPAILVGVEPHEASDQEHRQSDIWINPKQRLVDEAPHVQAPAFASSAARSCIAVPA